MAWSRNIASYSTEVEYLEKALAAPTGIEIGPFESDKLSNSKAKAVHLRIRLNAARGLQRRLDQELGGPNAVTAASALNITLKEAGGKWSVVVSKGLPTTQAIKEF